MRPRRSKASAWPRHALAAADSLLLAASALLPLQPRGHGPRVSIGPQGLSPADCVDYMY
jgi:hypothetical protein